MGYSKEELIKIRRELHQIPEVSFQEFKTKAYITEKLNTYGVAYTEIGETGLLATIVGEQEGNRILGIRCDMDALSLQEETDVEYRSKHEGCMHACGHDAHMAMQLIAIRYLNENKHTFGGTIKFIFQPAEEYVRGARMVLDSGLVDDVESFLGMHIWSDLPVGEVNIEEGPRMASVDMFKIHVVGKGGHGSAPHQCVDALVVASQILLSLQTFVSREVSPLEPVVLSIGKFEGGTAQNIIAEKAVLEGNIRGFNNALRKGYRDMLERICTNIAKAYRAEVVIEYSEGTPVLVNDTILTRLGEKIAKERLGETALVPFRKITASEDFAEFSVRKPSIFAFVGCRNEELGKCLPHHNPKFDIDEDGMIYGVELMIGYAVGYLKQ